MLTERGKQVRKSALMLMRKHGLTHIGGSFSCAEVLLALYDYVMNDDDVFILSKGHGCGVWYVLLRERGFSPNIETHPHRDDENGILFTTGSLGHGIGLGIGVALAKKIKKEPGRVFVLLGDGETQEGTFWEGLHISELFGLNNLFVLVDVNGLQGSGYLPSVDYIGVYGVLPSYFNMVDGYKVDGIVDAINRHSTKTPCFLLVNTVKGGGIGFLSDTVRSHSCWLSEDEYNKALEELS